MKPTFLPTLETGTKSMFNVAFNGQLPYNSCGGMVIVKMLKTTNVPYCTDPTKLGLHFSELIQVSVQ